MHPHIHPHTDTHQKHAADLLAFPIPYDIVKSISCNLVIVMQDRYITHVVFRVIYPIFLAHVYLNSIILLHNGRGNCKRSYKVDE